MQINRYALKEIRERSGLSISQLAEAIDSSPGYLHDLDASSFFPHVSLVICQTTEGFRNGISPTHDRCRLADGDFDRDELDDRRRRDAGARRPHPSRRRHRRERDEPDPRPHRRVPDGRRDHVRQGRPRGRLHPDSRGRRRGEELRPEGDGLPDRLGDRCRGTCVRSTTNASTS